MKKLLASVLIFSSIYCKAQLTSTETIKSNNFAIGYNLNEFAHDFGVGVNLTSPYFVKNKLAIKVSENYQVLSYHDYSGTIMLAGYNNIKAGIVTKAPSLNKIMRVYSEGGMVLILCPKAFSDKTLRFGGYGILGFEFFKNTEKDNFSYFIELGAMGAAAVANKLPGAPIYANGFMTSVGFRVYL